MTAAWRLAPAMGLGWALVPGAALAQTLGQGESVEIGWWRVAGALALSVALAVGAAFALRTRLGVTVPLWTRRPRRLELVETLRLSHQLDLCIVKCDGKELLVAATPQGASVLGAVLGEPQEGQP